MGHVAYSWKTCSDIAFLEFGNGPMSPDESKIRLSFEVAADGMAAALGVESIFAGNSPFEVLEASLETKLELWGYSVGLMCHILWKLLASDYTPDQLIQQTMTFEDAHIHPDPIKRRFNIEAFVGMLGDPDSPEGNAKNALVIACFGRGVSYEYAATEKTPILEQSDPRHVLSFMKKKFDMLKPDAQRKGGFFRSLFRPKDQLALMQDPHDWITEVHRVSDLVQASVTQAEMEFRHRFLLN